MPCNAGTKFLDLVEAKLRCAARVPGLPPDWHRSGLVRTPQAAATPRHDHLRPANDLACGPDGVLQLIATHQPATRSTSRRSSFGRRPPTGDTSRISIESRSRPVRIR